tara:strand:- start:1146 stop:1556 length:411 start_codon:yes stop_codon:yes gene_type:complete
MIDEIKNIKLVKKDLKNFGFIIGIILSLFGLFLFYKQINYFTYFVSFGLTFLSLGLIAPKILKPIYKVWMTFAVVIGWIMTRIILSVFFYSVITGIAILTRIIGKDFLNLKINNKESYWNNRDNDRELKQDYEKQF